MKKLIILISVIFILGVSTPLFSESKDNKKESVKQEKIDFEKEVEKYLQKLSGNSVDHLISAVHKSKKPVKVAAIRKLGEIKSDKCIELLTAVMTYIVDPSMYEDKYAKEKEKAPSFNEEVRAEAAIALGKINNEKSVKLIGNTLLADRNPVVKMGCMKGLSMTKRKEAIDYIDNYLRYELQLSKKEANNEVVKEGINALGEIGHKNAFFILVDITQSDNLEYETKKEALRALEKIRWE